MKKRISLKKNMLFVLVLSFIFNNHLLSQDPEGVNLLYGPSIEAYNIHNPAYKALRINVEGQSFTEAFDILVDKVPEKIHHVCLSANNRTPISKGDVIYIRWTGKSMNDGNGKGQLFVQSEKQWDLSLANEIFDLKQEWQTWKTFFVSPQDYEPNTLYFNFFFGHQVQNVAMADIVVINCGQKNIDELRKTIRPAELKWDFEGQFHNLEIKSEKSIISGEIAADWEDDSWWADVVVDYSKDDQNPFSGKGALLVKVKEIRKGSVQFRVPAVKIEKPWFVKIQLALKSTTSSSIKFGIRKSASPYNYYGAREVVGSPEWQKVELLIPPVVNDPAANLIFELNSPAVIEIDDVIVSYLSADEIAGNIDMKGNLLTTSSFPIGLSYPWSPFHEGYTPENYTPDPENEGPTGLPSLKIKTADYEGGKGVAAITSPFFGIGDRYYTYSFWAKAENYGHNINMRIGPPSEKLWESPYQKTITLGKEWKRFKFTLKLPYSPDGFYIAQIFNWGPKGTFWIDGVQIEATEEVSEFKRTGEVELAMKLKKNNYGLVEEREKFQIKAVVYGKIEDGMILRNELFDVYGKSYQMPEIKLNPGKIQYIEFEVQESGQPEFGSYRMESSVINKDGTIVSKICETILHRIRRAKFADKFLISSPFGVHITANNEMPGIARKLGFTWARCFGLNWQNVEKEKGVWTLEKLDGIINNINSQNLCILGILGGIPEWARSWNMPVPPPKGYNNWHAKNVLPKNNSDFAEYSRRMAEHFKDKVQAWETWNEPFLPGFLNVGFENGKYIHPSPEAFLKMHEAASAGVKKGNPNALTVINLGCHYNPPSDKWSMEILKKGGAQIADIISYHSYLPTGIGYPGDSIYNATKLNKNPENLNTEVWNTEGGPGPFEVRNFYRHSAPLGKAEMSAYWGDYLIRYYVSTLASGGSKFFLYLLYGWGDYKATYSMMNVDGKIHPCLTAFSNMAWHLEGRKYCKTTEILPDIFAYSFEGTGGTSLVILSKGIARGKLLAIAENALARDLFGNKLKLPATIGEYAIFIESSLTTDELIKSISAK